MRSYYLMPGGRRDACRGGVGDGNGEHELEIGSDCNCSPIMMALAVHVDEIHEFLGLASNNSPIARMLRTSLLNVETDIRLGLIADEEASRKRDVQPEKKEEASDVTSNQ